MTAAYLRRFRTIYPHLAASVVGLTIESRIMSAMGMGMGAGSQQPNASEILEKTDQELGSLSDG